MNRKCEYILELSTESRKRVGYNGKHTVIRCRGIAIAVLCESDNVSCL